MVVFVVEGGCGQLHHPVNNRPFLPRRNHDGNRLLGQGHDLVFKLSVQVRLGAVAHEPPDPVDQIHHGIVYSGDQDQEGRSVKQDFHKEPICGNRINQHN